MTPEEIEDRICKIKLDMQNYLVDDHGVSQSDFYLIKRIAKLELAVETLQRLIIERLL